MSSITTLFLDMDGTLVDTDQANLLAYREAIRRVTGQNLSISCNNGRFTRKQLQQALPQLDAANLEEIIALKETCYKNLLPATQLLGKTAALLQQQHRRHQTVLVTRSGRERAILTLRHHGLLGCFNELFCGEKRANKYAVAIAQLDVAPACVAVFENEAAEACNAVAAGIPAANIMVLAA